MDSKNVVATFLFLGMTLSCAAQPQLVLVKGDKFITAFKEADYIRFKRSDRDQFNTGFIAGMTSDYFRIGRDTTYIHQIEKIDISDREKTGFPTRAIGATLMTAGIVLFVGDLVNETVVNDQEYTASTGVITASAILVSTGLIMQFANNDIFVIGRRKKIMVLER